MAWVDLAPLTRLEAKGKLVVRSHGRQILLMLTPRGLFACANRCPHEGYPLSEGVLTDGCVLTCNWHNWKFDLASGETLVGGDQLSRFPVRVEDGRVFADLTPPDPARQRERILIGLVKALEDQDQQRLVRETARLMRLGLDPGEAVAVAAAWSAERFEFGTTHAIAGAPDWLELHDRQGTSTVERLAAIGEILGHIADDARAGRIFPYPQGEAAWDETAFQHAIENADEARAIALVRGALRSGLSARDLLPTLSGAALSHYADFGHSLIYVVKTAALVERVGPTSAEPLLKMLVRSLVYATREDMLPEFRDYHARLAGWGRARGRAQPLDPTALRGRSARQAMALVAGWGARHPPEQIFTTLLEAAGWTLLHVDERLLTRTDAPIADNIGWLDFTHVLTFADAWRSVAGLRPDLWPAALLQLTCFIGRNAGYLDPELDTAPFAVSDPEAFAASATTDLFDHGRERFIISIHLIKTLMATLRLAQAQPAAAPTLLAGVNRFLGAPIKGRHVLRTARQMHNFVAQE
jgi:nitrite reductase/ring-hydroxylating ferredoxin subunit